MSPHKKYALRPATIKTKTMDGRYLEFFAIQIFEDRKFYFLIPNSGQILFDSAEARDAELSTLPCPPSRKFLTWPQVKGRIISATKSGTVEEFARSIGYTPQSLRIALEGKAPRALARMEAILGSLAT